LLAHLWSSQRPTIASYYYSVSLVWIIVAMSGAAKKSVATKRTAATASTKPSNVSSSSVPDVVGRRAGSNQSSKPKSGNGAGGASSGVDFNKTSGDGAGLAIRGVAVTTSETVTAPTTAAAPSTSLPSSSSSSSPIRQPQTIAAVVTPSTTTSRVETKSPVAAASSTAAAASTPTSSASAILSRGGLAAGPKVTGVVYDERCLLHVPPGRHVECPERISESFQV
jgi:hypothetical protein